MSLKELGQVLWRMGQRYTSSSWGVDMSKLDTSFEAIDKLKLIKLCHKELSDKNKKISKKQYLEDQLEIEGYEEMIRNRLYGNSSYGLRFTKYMIVSNIPLQTIALFIGSTVRCDGLPPAGSMVGIEGLPLTPFIIAGIASVFCSHNISICTMKSAQETNAQINKLYDKYCGEDLD